MVRIQNFNTGVAQAHFGAEAGNGAGNASNTRTPDASSPFKGFTDHAADNNAPRRAIGDRFRSFFRGDVKGALWRATKMAVARPRGWVQTAISLMAFGGVPVFFFKDLAEGLIGANTWVKASKRFKVTNFSEAHNPALHVEFSRGNLHVDQNRTVWDAVKGLFTGREAFDQQIARVWNEGGEAGRDALRKSGVNLKKAGITEA
ncbi:MAG: hypothetical protein IPK79_09675 [Vampirovibrionales bacterium]|nr:hypothetical protein [Vampirovibrionales bacterium]